MALRTIIITAARNQSLSTVVINRGPAGPAGADGIGGGSIAYGDLTDAATANLPTVNTPLANALSSKAPLVSPSFTTPNLGTPSAGDLTNCTFPTLNQSTTGNAATATALETGRTINGVTFDGTSNITVTAAAGTLTGTTLASNVVFSSLTSVGTITTGTWNGTTIALANGGTGSTTAAGARTNLGVSATPVEDYLIGNHTLTSSGGTVTVDASNGHVQKFPLTENAVMGTPSNLSDGESMRIDGTQDATSRTLSFTGFKIHGGGAASDIGSLAALKGFTLSIWRVGGEYRLSILTEA